MIPGYVFLGRVNRLERFWLHGSSAGGDFQFSMRVPVEYGKNMGCENPLSPPKKALKYHEGINVKGHCDHLPQGPRLRGAQSEIKKNGI